MFLCSIKGLTKCLGILFGDIWYYMSVCSSLIYPAIHWALLKISIRNFAAFSKISALWTVFGIILYMIKGSMLNINVKSKKILTYCNIFNF